MSFLKSIISDARKNIAASNHDNKTLASSIDRPDSMHFNSLRESDGGTNNLKLESNDNSFQPRRDGRKQKKLEFNEVKMNIPSVVENSEQIPDVPSAEYCHEKSVEPDVQSVLPTELYSTKKVDETVGYDYEADSKSVKFENGSDPQTRFKVDAINGSDKFDDLQVSVASENQVAESSVEEISSNSINIVDSDSIDGHNSSNKKYILNSNKDTYASIQINSHPVDKVLPVVDDTEIFSGPTLDNRPNMEYEAVPATTDDQWYHQQWHNQQHHNKGSTEAPGNLSNQLNVTIGDVRDNSVRPIVGRQNSAEPLNSNSKLSFSETSAERRNIRESFIAHDNKARTEKFQPVQLSGESSFTPGKKPQLEGLVYFQKAPNTNPKKVGVKLKDIPEQTFIENIQDNLNSQPKTSGFNSPAKLQKTSENLNQASEQVLRPPAPALLVKQKSTTNPEKQIKSSLSATNSVSKPEMPKVQIGQIDVFIESSTKPVAKPQNNTSLSDFTSRNYLRTL